MQPAELPLTSAAQRSANRTSKDRFKKRRDADIKMTVTIRRQTPQEARKFASAFDLLVAELVSHELNRARSKQS